MSSSKRGIPGWTVSFALKVLPSRQRDGPERRLRFVHEAKAGLGTERPEHPTVHEIASEGEIDFIVTEYVQGQTLAGLIPRAGLHPRVALRYAVQIRTLRLCRRRWHRHTGT